MLHFHRTSVSERIEVNKTSTPKVCEICHYWDFLNYSFKLQPKICNRCHDLLMMFMNLSNIAILSNKGSDYHYIISLWSQSTLSKKIEVC